LVVIAVVADRLAVSAAQQAVSVRAKQAALLASDPSVSIRGFPFLTQALAGRYREIDITTHGIRRGGVRLDTVSARFFGVHVSLSAALAGKVASVPIDRGEGSVLVTYADLNTSLTKRRVSLSQNAGTLHVAGDPVVAGKRVEVAGDATVSSTGGVLSVVPVASSLRVAGAKLPAPVAKVVAGLLTITVNTPSLPFGLQLTGVQVEPTGLLAGAVAKGLVIPVPADASRSTG
jgi:hypothetical protein